MMFKLEERLAPTNPEHRRFVEAYACMFAGAECRLIDSYCLLYVRTSMVDARTCP